MYCNKCGKEISPGVKFCQGCGNPVGENNSPTTENVVSAPVNSTVVEAKPVNGDGVVNNTPAPKKKSVLPIILIILGVFLLFIIGIVVLSIFVFKGITSTSNRLVCESNEGNITIYYTEKTITGYTANGGITYDFDTQKKLADQRGGEAYADEFTKWFENNTSGTCKKELNVEEPEIEKNKSDVNDPTKTEPTVKTRMVGEEKFGYIDIPEKWGKFTDVNGGHQIQFSYGQTYIVTIDYVESPASTAKVVAESFYNKEKADSEVTNVTMETTTVGKEKYTAYKVGMYYPSEAIHLYTYWFDIPGDPNMHYLAIEGPSDVEDYNYIIDSYRLTK